LGYTLYIVQVAYETCDNGGGVPMIVMAGSHGRSQADQLVEIVERKGSGHPDSICDAVMEAISVALCQAYLAEFGTILHHNIDKGLLVAGRVRKWFGGGEVEQPMELIIGDRATFAVGKRELDVSGIARRTAQKWFKENLRFVDPDSHLTVRVALAPGSEELTDIFSRGSGVLAANDTSAAVGYYPLTPCEEMVLALERHLNSAYFKAEFPETGEDVKVMAMRHGHEVDITVAMPLLATLIPSEEEYFHCKGRVLGQIEEYIARVEGFNRKTIHFNSLDSRGRGLGGVYLSLLGTSAEDADSGQVGRGNRVNGLIPLGRPLGSEAAAGKNPVSHVGKIYNFLAHRLARRICEAISGITGAQVTLLSRIGTPIDQPVMVSVELQLAPGRRMGDIRQGVEEIIAAELAAVEGFCLELARGAYPVC
jgi:S-adenosylmethionine synthetase